MTSGGLVSYRRTSTPSGRTHEVRLGSPLIRSLGIVSKGIPPKYSLVNLVKPSKAPDSIVIILLSVRSMNSRENSPEKVALVILVIFVLRIIMPFRLGNPLKKFSGMVVIRGQSERSMTSVSLGMVRLKESVNSIVLSGHRKCFIFVGCAFTEFGFHSIKRRRQIRNPNIRNKEGHTPLLTLCHSLTAVYNLRICFNLSLWTSNQNLPGWKSTCPDDFFHKQ